MDAECRREGSGTLHAESAEWSGGSVELEAPRADAGEGTHRRLQVRPRTAAAAVRAAMPRMARDQVGEGRGQAEDLEQAGGRRR